jgi:predicted amidohydrolase YtcJ
MCTAVDREGFQIHVHSIGDAATRLTLDGFADARAQNGRRDSRHSITHLQLVNDRDLDRFASLEAVAVVQPFWFLVDANYQQALEYIGPQRAAHQYPMAGFLRRGVLVAGASDYNVTLQPDPLVAIEMGVTRRVPEGCPGYAGALAGQVLWPEERVSVEEMITAFTISGAKAAFLEEETGSLEPGKKADFIILDENIFEIDPSRIHTARVLETFFEGRQVYHNPTSPLEELKSLESD